MRATAAAGACTGADNLEVMHEARHYNAWLLCHILRHANVMALARRQVSGNC